MGSGWFGSGGVSAEDMVKAMHCYRDESQRQIAVLHCDVVKVVTDSKHWRNE